AVGQAALRPAQPLADLTASQRESVATSTHHAGGHRALPKRGDDERPRDIPADADRCPRGPVRPVGRRGQHRAVLAPTRSGWLVRAPQRTHLGAIHALLERRRPLDLYHTALVVRVPEGRFVVENCWPISDGDGSARGVLVEGPVGSRRMGRWRVFRYEVRRWRDGVIADADESVASPSC